MAGVFFVLFASEYLPVPYAVMSLIGKGTLPTSKEVKVGQIVTSWIESQQAVRDVAMKQMLNTTD